MPQFTCNICNDGVIHTRGWRSCPSGHVDITEVASPPTPVVAVISPAQLATAPVSAGPAVAVVPPVLSASQEFTAVTAAWNTAVAPVSHISVSTNGKKRWDYTITYQWSVQANGKTYTLRGHVHYTKRRNSPGYSKGPGNYWVSGIDNQSAPTPLDVVNRARGNPNPTGAGIGW